MNTGIVQAFLNLIHHIITPTKKKTSISQKERRCFYGKPRNLLHNRSGEKSKRSKRALLGVRCSSESKMYEVDSKVLGFISSLNPNFKGNAVEISPPKSVKTNTSAGADEGMNIASV